MNIREANAEDMINCKFICYELEKNRYRFVDQYNFLNGLTVNDGIKKWQEYLTKEKHRIFVAYGNENFLGFSACKEDEELKNCCIFRFTACF